MLKHPCIPCQHGDHEGHIEWPGFPGPGIIGGHHCPCKGECRHPEQPSPDSLGGQPPTEPKEGK